MVQWALNERFQTMETRTNKTEKLSADPRIDSPVVRVVYPADPLTISTSGTTPVEKAAADTVPAEPVLKLASPEVATPTDPAPSPAPMTLGSWLEVIKNNAAVFLSVGLICLAIGYLIGKNKA